MKNNKKHINPGGVNGSGKGVVNTNSKDFIGLQTAIMTHASRQSKEEQIEYALLSIRYQMESYIAEVEIEEVKGAGQFLKEFLEAIEIKHKVFAQYVGIEESNLSSILKGRRKINVDFAFKLGSLFQINPDLWLMIQSKNELLKIDKLSRTKYEKFKLEDLLKKAS